MQPIDALSCLLKLFASAVRLRLWYLLSTSTWLSFSLFLSARLSFCLPAFVLSLSVCPLDAFPSAFMAAPPGSWVGDYCSSAVRFFPLIRRSILVPVIQSLVDSLYAALLTRSSCCHAPLILGIPGRRPAHCWPGVFVERRDSGLRVYTWFGIACIFWVHGHTRLLTGSYHS